MQKIIGILAVTFVTIGLSGNALAIAPFKKAFKAKYLDEHKDEKFQKLGKTAGCYVCHVKSGKVHKAKKEDQNDYGKLLNKLIEGSANQRIKDAKAEGGPNAGKAETEKVLKELDAAFEKAEKEKSDGGKGPTYGELIKAGKLPVDLKVATAKFEAEKEKSGDNE